MAKMKKRLTIPNVDENIELPKLSYVAGGCEK